LLERLIPVALAILAYICLPLLMGSGNKPLPHFHQLADAFLHARLTIILPQAELARPHALDELIPTSQPDRYACPYPPLPAVLLMPIVAVTRDAAGVAAACRTISVVNTLLFSACLWRLPRRLGLPGFSPTTRTALTVFFALGTICWHNAEMGGDWHLAHAVALAASLLALREFLDLGRPVAIGAFVALAALARPTAALAMVFFALPLIRQRRFLDIVKLAAFPALAALHLALYNYARFGSPGDFGYERMRLRDAGNELMAAYGQFDQHFALRNFFWFFLAPPWTTSDGRFPGLGFDPRGLSLFLASPALLYALVAVRRCWRQPLVRDALFGIIACLVPLLLYFNTGYVQFGHRFSMDYLPMLMVLVIAGISRRGSPLGSADSVPGSRPPFDATGAYSRLTRLGHLAIASSILLQAWGVILRPVTTLPAWLAPSP
jgi:hypothetical protein